MANLTLDEKRKIACAVVTAITMECGEPITAQRMLRRFQRLEWMRLSIYAQQAAAELYRVLIGEVGPGDAIWTLREAMPYVVSMIQSQLQPILADGIRVHVDNFGTLVCVNFTKVDKPLRKQLLDILREAEEAEKQKKLGG